MRRYFILAIAIVALCVGGIVYYPKIFTLPAAPSVGAANVHVYKNSDKSIAKIRVEAFYAVPKNKSVDANWRTSLASALGDTAKFHALQFRGLSEVAYDTYPLPVNLGHEDVFYDTTSTAFGNPRGLINVAEEINRRVFQKGGDLYDEKFARENSGEYRVMGILYEGVGASGGLIYESPLASAEEIAKQLGVPASMVYIVNINSVEAFFLVNRNYLAQNALKSYGSSIFYHEFAHTIGLPDTFSSESGPSTSDIMGTGRNKPIENTYLDKNFLKEMGIP